MSDSAPQEATLTKVMDFVTKFMRPLNFIFGGATIAWGVINLLYSFSFGFDIILRAALSCAFTCILGLLLLVGEIPRLGFVKDQCKFLIICLGRGLFDIFIGGWIYSLPFIRGQGSIIEILFVITWISLFSLGGLFIFMHFCGKSKFIHSEEPAAGKEQPKV